MIPNFKFDGFQVAGIVDSILHNTIRMMKKVELGKNFWSKVELVKTEKKEKQFLYTLLSGYNDKLNWLECSFLNILQEGSFII